MSQAKNIEQSSELRRFKPYPRYKNSGIEWLGKIPVSWELRRLSQAVDGVMDFRGRTPAKLGLDWGGEIPALSAVNVRDGYVDLSRGVNYGSWVLYTRWMTQGPTKNGDILFTTEAPLGNVALVPDDQHYILSQRVVLLRPRQAQLESKYLQRFLSSAAFRQGVGAQATGSTAEGIKRRHLMSMVVAKPRIEEQCAIAAFLDRETTRIDALVAKKERLIQLLREKRTAVITRAVTKGLDRNVPMKQSGVEWLGELPLHWETFVAGRVLEHIEQGWSPEAEDRPAGSDEWAVIKLSAVSHGNFQAHEHKALPEGLIPDTRFEIRDGDFLLTRANTPELVGDVCVVRQTPPRLMLCDLIYRLRLNRSLVLPEFLSYWFLSKSGRHQIVVEARGSSQSMVKVSQRHIRSWTVLIPPMPEQVEIALSLNRETAKIDNLLAKVSEAIDRLKELRTALISEVVTGKIDVREDVA